MCLVINFISAIALWRLVPLPRLDAAVVPVFPTAAGSCRFPDWGLGGWEVGRRGGEGWKSSRVISPS